MNILICTSDRQHKDIEITIIRLYLQYIHINLHNQLNYNLNYSLQNYLVLSTNQ